MTTKTFFGIVALVILAIMAVVFLVQLYKINQAEQRKAERRLEAYRQKAEKADFYESKFQMDQDFLDSAKQIFINTAIKNLSAQKDQENQTANARYKNYSSRDIMADDPSEAEYYEVD